MEHDAVILPHLFQFHPVPLTEFFSHCLTDLLCKFIDSHKPPLSALSKIIFMDARNSACALATEKTLASGCMVWEMQFSVLFRHGTLGSRISVRLWKDILPYGCQS